MDLLANSRDIMNTKIIKIAIVSNEKFEICRLCGEKSLNCIPIFEDRDNYILEKISRCLPIIVFPNDNLPSSVCRRCLDSLNISCKLILTAVEVDKHLRMQLDQKQKNPVSTDKDVAAFCETPKISEIEVDKHLRMQLDQRQEEAVPTNKDVATFREGSKMSAVKVSKYLQVQLDHSQKNAVSTKKDVAFREAPKISAVELNKHQQIQLVQKQRKPVRVYTKIIDEGPKIPSVVGPIGCDLCDSHFKTVGTQFDRHTEQSYFLKWKCSLCDSCFDKSSELIAHKSSKHNGNIIVCNNCRLTYSQKANVNECDNIQDNKRDNKEKIMDKNIQNNQQTKQKTINKNNCKRIVTKNDKIAFIDLTMDNDDIEIEDDSIGFNEMDILMEQSDDSSDSDEMENDDDSDSETDRLIEQYRKILDQIKTTQTIEQAKLFCEICKLYFGNERHFNAHNRIHEEKVATCSTCSTKFSSIYDLFLHKREKHNKYKNSRVKYACGKCGKFFTHSWTWEAHKEDQCSEMEKKSCKYCNMVLPTQLKLTRHLRRHKLEMFNDPGVTVYKCVSCPKVFVDKEFYEKHRNVHDPECWNKYRCDTCGQPFRDKARLQEHQMAVHQNIKPYLCTVCGRSFLRAQSLKIHSRIHSGHDCNHCKEVFKRRVDLTKHLHEKHGYKLPSKPNLNKDYICRYCGKTLKSYISLTDHERIHTGEKPYKCSKCHRYFRSYTARWAHLQHHLKGMFVCEHCGKSYSYKRSLALHVLTHLPMEARKYECNICKKRFMRNAHLIIHQRIHYGIRPYKCDVCSVSFTQKGDMVRHRVRHFNKEKPVKKAKNTKIDLDLKNGKTD